MLPSSFVTRPSVGLAADPKTMGWTLPSTGETAATPLRAAPPTVLNLPDRYTELPLGFATMPQTSPLTAGVNVGSNTPVWALNRAIRGRETPEALRKGPPA